MALAAFFFAAVALLTVVAVTPLAAMGLALAGTGFERAWLAVLITLPIAVAGLLGIGQLLPGSVPWWFWPVTVSVAATGSVWLAAAMPIPVLSRSQ